MNRIKYILTAISFYGLSAAADQPQEFDFQKVVEIAAVKNDKYALFANPDIINPISDIVANSINRPDREVTIPQDKNIELVLIGIDGTSIKISMGDHWISDGKGVVTLSDSEFSTIMGPINSRTFDTDASTLGDLTKDVNLAEYRSGKINAQSDKGLVQNNDQASGRSGVEVYDPSVKAAGSSQNQAVEGTHKTISSMRSFSSGSSSLSMQWSRQMTHPPGTSSEMATDATKSWEGQNKDGELNPIVPTNGEIDVLTLLVGMTTVFAAGLFAFLWYRKR